MGVPLLVGGRVIGVLKIENISLKGVADERDFDQEVQQRLDVLAQGKVYLPLILKAPGPPPPPTGSRVVHVHDTEATYWDFSSGWYGA